MVISGTRLFWPDLPISLSQTAQTEVFVNESRRFTPFVLRNVIYDERKMRAIMDHA
jgi:hypothetical protein